MKALADSQSNHTNVWNEEKKIQMPFFFKMRPVATSNIKYKAQRQAWKTMKRLDQSYTHRHLFVRLFSQGRLN